MGQPATRPSPTLPCDGKHSRHDAWRCETEQVIAPIRRDGTPLDAVPPRHRLRPISPWTDPREATYTDQPDAIGDTACFNWRPTKDRVKEVLPVAIAEAPLTVRAGLLAEKFRDIGTHHWPKRVNDHFGTQFSTPELQTMAADARRWLDDWLKSRFECGASWHVRWLPEIAA